MTRTLSDKRDSNVYIRDWDRVRIADAFEFLVEMSRKLARVSDRIDGRDRVEVTTTFEQVCKALLQRPRL